MDAPCEGVGRQGVVGLPACAQPPKKKADDALSEEERTGGGGFLTTAADAVCSDSTTFWDVRPAVRDERDDRRSRPAMQDNLAWARSKLGWLQEFKETKDELT